MTESHPNAGPWAHRKNHGWAAKWDYPQGVRFIGNDEDGWQWVVRAGKTTVYESPFFASQFGARHNFMTVRRVMVAASIHAGELVGVDLRTAK